MTIIFLSAFLAKKTGAVFRKKRNKTVTLHQRTKPPNDHETD
jgi:hypothetical protein